MFAVFGIVHRSLRIIRYDEVLSRFAHSIICVSVAMKRDLDERLGVRYVSNAASVSLLSS